MDKSTNAWADVVDKIRDQMNAVGPNYIRSLHKHFVTTGESPNRRCTHADFVAALF